MMKSVLEFGAAGDGVRDDYAAFQAALDSGAAEIHIPQGVYPISGTLKVPSGVAILADPTAKIVMKSTARRHRGEFLLTNADPLGGNRDITIIGGIWDGNNQAPENAKPELFDEDGYSGALLNFVGVNGLILRDMVLANSVTYYVRMARLHRFVIENISFLSDKPGHNQDGLHFGGDVKHGTVKNIRALSDGQTNDDMIALNADDSIVRVENRDLVRDAIEDITFENIFASNCHTIIRMLSVTAPIRNIRIRHVWGGFRCYAINADAARYCRTPLFAETDYPDGVGAIQDVVIEDFTCSTTLAKPMSEAAIAVESQMSGFAIRAFRYRDDSGRCPALMVRNLCDMRIEADGAGYSVREKSDTVTLDNFRELQISRRSEKQESSAGFRQ